MEAKIGDTVMVRQLMQEKGRPGKVVALHEPGHVTCEIETENGTEIESVSYSKGLKSEGTWDVADKAK